MGGTLLYFDGYRNTEKAHRTTDKGFKQVGGTMGYIQNGGFQPFLISYRVFKSKLKYKT